MDTITLAPSTIITTDAKVLTGRSVLFLTNLFNNLSTKLKGPTIKEGHKLPKSQLVQKIIRLQADIAKANTTVVKPAIAKGAYDKKRNGPKLNKKASPKAKSTKAPSKPRNDELSKYIASMKLTPKQARSKFRRAKVKKVDGHYVLNNEVKKALAQ